MYIDILTQYIFIYLSKPKNIKPFFHGGFSSTSPPGENQPTNQPIEMTPKARISVIEGGGIPLHLIILAG